MKTRDAIVNGNHRETGQQVKEDHSEHAWTRGLTQVIDEITHLDYVGHTSVLPTKVAVPPWR